MIYPSMAQFVFLQRGIYPQIVQILAISFLAFSKSARIECAGTGTATPPCRGSAICGSIGPIADCSPGVPMKLQVKELEIKSSDVLTPVYCLPTANCNGILKTGVLSSFVSSVTCAC